MRTAPASRITQALPGHGALVLKAALGRQDSVMTASATRLPALIAAVLALGLVAACSSGGGGSASPAQAAAAAGLPTSTAGVGDNGSIDAKVCAAIASDVAAITRNVAHPATFPGQCAFGGGATTVSFYLNDPQHSDVTDVLGTTGTAISGIGDHAVWVDNGGETAVSLGAWQGGVSCLVQPDSNVANDTVTYTGKPPFTKISAADAASYAAKLGKVCTDVFAAAG
jgi:hypothetical protein